MKKGIIFIIMIMMLLFSGCSFVQTINDKAPTNNYLNDALITIDKVEDKTDRGDAFVASHLVNVPSGETYTYTGVTDGRSIHLDLRKVTIFDLANSNANIRIDLYENVTTLVEGDMVQINNINRDYVNMAGIQNHTFDIYNGSTADFTGSTHLMPLSGRLTAEKRQATFLLEEVKYVMARNQTYALNITNNGLGDVEIRIIWKWYEQKREE